MTLDAKLDVFDRYAREAVYDLVDWMLEHRDDLIAVARGRHVTGHYLYEDRNFAEYDIPRLRAETAEELGDAIVYTARKLYLEEAARADPERPVAPR